MLYQFRNQVTFEYLMTGNENYFLIQIDCFVGRVLEPTDGPYVRNHLPVK